MILRRWQTPVVLMLLALGVWLFTIPTHNRLPPLQADVYAYIDLLPVGYWVSVALLFAAVAVRLLFGWRDETIAQGWDLLLLAVFAVILFGTPSVLEGTPRFFDAYGHYSVSIRIDNISDVSFPSREPYVGETPGAFLFFAVLREITGLSDFAIMLWYPVASRFLIALGLYAIARVFGLRGGAVAAGLLFLGASWFEEMHVSPQSVGLLYYVLALLCLVSLWVSPPATQAARWRILVMVFAGVAVLSHPGSPIFIGFTLAALTLALVLTSRRSPIGLPFLRVQDHRPTHYFGLFLLASVGYFSWQINYAINGFHNITAQLRDAVRGLSRGQSPTLDKIGQVVEPAYSQVNHLKELGYVAVLLLALVAGVYIILRGTNDAKSRAVALAASTAGCILFLIVPTLVGGQYVERAALFSLFSLTLLCAFAFGYFREGIFAVAFRVAVVGVICVTAGLLPLTRSASDPFEWASQVELDGTRFATQLSGNNGPRFERVANNNRPYDFYRNLDEVANTKSTTLGAPFKITPKAVIFTSPTGLGFVAIRYQQGEDYRKFVETLEQAQNRVFDGGDGVNVYYVRP